MAPGDLNYILCSENYPGCVDDDGGPSPIYQSGGTSESAPLTAGEAALVDQAYADAHKGAMPSPAVVKEIITSTATDLDEPAVEQGAGLINSYRAVVAARNWGRSASKAKGEALISSASDLSATAAPGTAENLKFSVTNDGKETETVSPRPLLLGTPFNVQNFSVALNPKTSPEFLNPGGALRDYEKQTFTVGSHVDHLEASAAWNVTTQPGTIAYLFLYDPHNRLAAYSVPQGFGSGYGHVDVHNPSAGTWTAVVASRIVGSSAYAGAIQLSVASSDLVPMSEAGGHATVTPAKAKILPGKTKAFTLHTAIPSRSGDASAEIRVMGKGPTKATSVTAGTIPVYLRSLVSLSGKGGSFTGTFLGTNGRGGQPDYQTWAFNVPSGLKDLDASISLTDSNYDINGYLVNPGGLAEDFQTTVTANNPQTGAPTAETNGMQFYYRSPKAGIWHLVLAVINSSGQQISEPFSGSIAFNQGAASVVASNVPDNTSTLLTKGSTNNATLAITNTSGVTENYFVDPRSSQDTELYLGEVGEALPGPGVGIFVPPDTTELAVKAVSANPQIPIDMDVSAPAGGPDIAGTTQFELPGLWASTDVIDSPAGSRELSPGGWGADAQMVGPFGAATTDDVLIGALAETAAFASDVTSSTGDQWQFETGQAATPATPLTLAPGKTGDITVTFTPGESSGTPVSGDLEVDTFSAPVVEFINGGGADEVTSIPFAYTVK